jgi:phosphate transport system permease protein
MSELAIPQPGGAISRAKAEGCVPPAHRNRTGARLFAGVMRFLVRLAAGLTALVLAVLVGYILVTGIPNLKPALFVWTYTSDNVSLMPALLNTVLMTVFSLLIATPLGIFSAVYLVEYARRGSRLVKLVRLTAETLQGIPSIVYGLFGMLFFVTQLHWGLSLLSGACTLAIMILPLVMRTTEEALLSVPDAYREGSFGLGAGKLRTVFTIVVPSAMPGILSGVILGTGRIVGETAALLYTAGSVAAVASGTDFLFDSTRTLAVHMYLLSSEGLHVGEACGTAVVLLGLVLLINGISGLIAKKLTKGDVP